VGGTSAIQIKSVTFGDGSHPTQWATVSDTGGKAEILGNSFVGPTDCASYGGPFCTYPFYTQGSSGVHYGTDFPNQINDSAGGRPVRSDAGVWRAVWAEQHLLRHAPSRSFCRNR
jgi:hypothetical protein